MTWPTKKVRIASLLLDAKNPRLSRALETHAQSDLIEALWRNHKAGEIAAQIASHGYYPNEPLLAVEENGKLVVVEGNRRLAALKGLRTPDLLPQPFRRRAENLAKRLDISSLQMAPVTVAPSRRDTDQQVAGRHTMSSVLPWEAENRAAFILEKLDEGRTTQDLVDELGFRPGDIQEARKTRALAEMARSIQLPEQIARALDGPKRRVLSTVERVFDSKPGRAFFHATPDFDHGLRFDTSASQFVKGYKKLLTDLVTGKVDSRRLNKSEDIENYLASWTEDEKPAKKKANFVPSDVIGASEGDVLSVSQPTPPRTARGKAANKYIVPKSFRCLNGSPRVKEICAELQRMKRAEFPNAGVVLLRVFLELSAIDYLERTGQLKVLCDRLEKKNALPHGIPELKHLIVELKKVARERLSKGLASSVERALATDSAAPLTVNSLNAFVHQAQELPSEREIDTFWNRIAPLFEIMLSQPTTDSKA